MQMHRIAALLIVGIAVVVFLLVVLVFQASIARIILQDIRGNNVLHQSALVDADDNDRTQNSSARVVGTYGLVVNTETSASLLASHGAPPAQRGYAVCASDKEPFTMQPVTYPVTCWLPLRPSPNSIRLQQDVAAGRVSTLIVANVAVKVWLASWPGDDSREGKDPLLVVAPSTAARPDDPESYTVLHVVEPVFTSSSTAAWGAFTGSLASGGHEDLPVHVWAY